MYYIFKCNNLSYLYNNNFVLCPQPICFTLFCITILILTILPTLISVKEFNKSSHTIHPEYFVSPFINGVFNLLNSNIAVVTPLSIHNFNKLIFFKVMNTVFIYLVT